jgi:hypothetical protein
VSTKLSPEQRAAFSLAAAGAQRSESEFLRDLILSTLEVSPEMRLLVTVQSIGEERLRLMMQAAQDAKRLSDPAFQSALERQALEAGTRLAQIRINTLPVLQLETPKSC